MTIVLIILGIYIGMVVVSLLSPYVDFKKNHCEKRKEIYIRRPLQHNR